MSTRALVLVGVVLIASSGCERDSARSHQPHSEMGQAKPHSPPEAGIDETQPEARKTNPPAPEPKANDLGEPFRRSPALDARCDPAFPLGFSVSGGDVAGLLERIGVGDEVPPVSAAEARSRGLRCYACGPHRGLNLAHWCCSEAFR